MIPLSVNQFTIFLTDFFHALLLLLLRSLHESDQLPRRILDSDCVCRFHLSIDIISQIYYDILIWIYILSHSGMIMNTSLLKQSHRLGYTAGFVGILHLEFADDLLTMAAYGVNADVQLTGDFPTFHSHIYH